MLAIGLAGSREVIAVAGPTRDIDRAVGSLIALLAFTIPVALVMSVAGGYLVSARAMRPVDWMTREAAAIGADDLSVRLDVPSTSDEIERLGRTLNQLLSRLSASMEEQRRFTADASHELRTPLSIMRGEIDTTLRSHDLAPDARPALESLGEEVDRMSGLVSDLLTLSRMDAGSAELSRERVRLAELCDKVAGRFSARAAAKAVTLDVQGEDLTVWADLDLLDRMIGNLVDNAIKYSPPGGLVRLAVRRDGDWADMTVADSGAGIAPEDLPHVFERFWRADKARARAEGGAGLGLSICRWIAEAHCGSIAASSHPGGGTTITVRLPLERDA